MQKYSWWALLLTLAVVHFTQAEPTAGEQLYLKHCQQCHGNNRIGALGPALLPESLSRLKRKAAQNIIENGLPASQMPAFKAQLDANQIDRLTEFIYSPTAITPTWKLAEIKASHKIMVPSGNLPAQPVYQADMMNLFVVVEMGDHHVTILDGDRFEPIHRFKSHYALHGGPKFSPTGRFVYFASRDGWISKFDLYSLKTVAEIRVALNTRNLAASSDGRYLMVANYLPKNLVVLNADDLSVLKIIDAMDIKGNLSRVSAVYNAPPRNSFIVALKDVKEVWEISYQEKETFPIRRINVDDYLDDFFFDAKYQNLIGSSRKTHNGQVINLDAGRKIATIELSGMPHLGSGIYWRWRDKMVMATPNIRKGLISIIDLESWQLIKEIPTDGPGFFMRSHKNSPYAWTDVFFGPNKEAVHIIDKQSLEIVTTLKPAAGKNAAHVEFSKDGRYVLLSIWDMDGALIVYDAKTLKEIKRLPMKKPSGKYNVFNKINYAEGTSH